MAPSAISCTARSTCLTVLEIVSVSALSLWDVSITVPLCSSIRPITFTSCPRRISTALLMAPISSFLSLSFFWSSSSRKSSPANRIASSAICRRGFTITLQQKKAPTIQTNIVIQPQKIQVQKISFDDFISPPVDFMAASSSAVMTNM